MDKLLKHLAKHVGLTLLTSIVILFWISAIIPGSFILVMVGIVWLMAGLKDINKSKRRRR